MSRALGFGLMAIGGVAEGVGKGMAADHQQKVNEGAERKRLAHQAELARQREEAAMGRLERESELRGEAARAERQFQMGLRDTASQAEGVAGAVFSEWVGANPDASIAVKLRAYRAALRSAGVTGERFDALLKGMRADLEAGGAAGGRGAGKGVAGAVDLGDRVKYADTVRGWVEGNALVTLPGEDEFSEGVRWMPSGMQARVMRRLDQMAQGQSQGTPVPPINAEEVAKWMLDDIGEAYNQDLDFANQVLRNLTVEEYGNKVGGLLGALGMSVEGSEVRTTMKALLERSATMAKAEKRPLVWRAVVAKHILDGTPLTEGLAGSWSPEAGEGGEAPVDKDVGAVQEVTQALREGSPVAADLLKKAVPSATPMPRETYEPQGPPPQEEVLEYRPDIKPSLSIGNGALGGGLSEIVRPSQEKSPGVTLRDVGQAVSGVGKEGAGAVKGTAMEGLKSRYAAGWRRFEQGKAPVRTLRGLREAPGPGEAPKSPAYGPLGARNNNFGNLRPIREAGGALASGTQQWDGMTGEDKKGFAQFRTPEEGTRAAARNLITYGSKHGLNTVREIVFRWAPPGDNNDTVSYVRSVAKRTGFEPDETLDMSSPEVLSRLLSALFHHEIGVREARKRGLTPQALRPLVDAELSE